MATSYDALVGQIESLGEADLLKVIEVIVRRLRDRRPGQGHKGRLSEMYGLGADAWQGVDPVTYLREERDTWER